MAAAGNDHHHHAGHCDGGVPGVCSNDDNNDSIRYMILKDKTSTNHSHLQFTFDFMTYTNHSLSKIIKMIVSMNIFPRCVTPSERSSVWQS